MNNLAGKVALVTGASRGIGLATARELSSQGATVVLAARSQDLVERYAADLRGTGRKASAAVFTEVALQLRYSSISDLMLSEIKSIENQGDKWWFGGDLNSRPHDYESCALTS